MSSYDCIVIGGGHAGIEAALAASKDNLKVALITTNINTIGHMPCNPSIGGSAKGIVVREIDALGGAMAQLADINLLQIKMLNKSKGPAVWSLRAQIDIEKYSASAIELLQQNTNITLINQQVNKLFIENSQAKGVFLDNNILVNSKTIIITAGTYLNSAIYKGGFVEYKGPNNFPSNKFLSKHLKEEGYYLKRLKTGTPPRVQKDTIDFKKMPIEKGDNEELNFCVYPREKRMLANLNCYLTYIEEKGICVIKDNLQHSALYSGDIKGIGPRYCPSIEDKIVRFSDKNRHQLFIEPISLSSNLMYVQGLSTSMPAHIQEKFIKTIKGLENCTVVEYGYAIEYDSIDPTQLKHSLESKITKNLFFAGQVNGTSGYEEAAAQGLIAGINARNKVLNKKPLILKRNEAYIGVMIDDLVIKGVNDPYRLLTSRAEYRLLLRGDNAIYRLYEHAYYNNMIDNKIYENTKKTVFNIEKYLKKFKENFITPKQNINNYFKSKQIPILYDQISIFDFIKKDQIDKSTLQEVLAISNINFEDNFIDKITKEEWFQIKINVKYDGYIKKTYKEIEKLNKIENKEIPEDINYSIVPNLSLEAKEKFQKIMPKTLAQAIRIPGINSVDIMLLNLYMKKLYNSKSKEK